MELSILKQVRKPTLDLPVSERKKMWFGPFIRSYLVVFVSYMVMYFIRKNFNIAQNDLISDYGMTMTQLGTIGLGFSITYGIGKTALNYWCDGKNSKKHSASRSSSIGFMYAGLRSCNGSFNGFVLHDDRPICTIRSIPKCGWFKLLFNHH